MYAYKSIDTRVVQSWYDTIQKRTTTDEHLIGDLSLLHGYVLTVHKDSTTLYRYHKVPFNPEPGIGSDREGQ